MSSTAPSPGAKRRPRLDLYIDESCGVCADAVAIVEAVRQWFTEVQLQVRVHELDEGALLPAGIVAVPALLLDDRLIQYGTPDRAELRRLLVDSVSEGRPESSD